MNSKWHAYISFFKSGIRIIGCCIAVLLQSLTVLAISLLCAELLGILEEIGDNR